MRPSPPGLVTLFGLLALEVGLAAGARGEVPHIRNREPAHAPRIMHLEELWRVGGAEGEILFGTVTEAATDSTGNVYLLDTQLCHVEVIAPTGEHLRTLGREGDGPGEVRRPRDVLLMPNGTVGLLEMFPAKIVTLSPDGEPRGSVTLGSTGGVQGGFTAASRCVHRGGTLLLVGQDTGQNETGQRRVMYLSRIDESGRETVRYAEAMMTLEFANLCFVERELSPGIHLANEVGPDGRVYAAEAWDRYAIRVFAADGTPERVIEREFANRTRTAEELRRIHALFDASDRNIGRRVDRVIEPAPAVIVDLRVDAEGNLWVEHSRSGEDESDQIMVTYDLFDPQGRYLQAVAVACNGDPEQDGLVFLDDGRLLLIKGYAMASMARTDLGNVPLGEDDEEASPLEVVCYRVRD